MTKDQLEQDLLALAASLDDPVEAEALRELFALTADLEIELNADEDYTPFVYPH